MGNRKPFIYKSTNGKWAADYWNSSKQHWDVMEFDSWLEAIEKVCY